MRRWLNTVGQGRIVALLAFALLVRAVVPTGWMPVATAQGLRLELCAAQNASPQPMAGMHHGHRQSGGQALPDHPCAFAGIGLAADTAPPPALPSLAPTIAPAATPRSLAAGVGRGLAAPPPPATGPPAFA